MITTLLYSLFFLAKVARVIDKQEFLSHNTLDLWILFYFCSVSVWRRRELIICVSVSSWPGAMVCCDCWVDGYTGCPKNIACITLLLSHTFILIINKHGIEQNGPIGAWKCNFRPFKDIWTDQQTYQPIITTVGGNTKVVWSWYVVALHLAPHHVSNSEITLTQIYVYMYWNSELGFGNRVPYCWYFNIWRIDSDQLCTPIESGWQS